MNDDNRCLYCKVKLVVKRKNKARKYCNNMCCYNYNKERIRKQRKLDYYRKKAEQEQQNV